MIYLHSPNVRCERILLTPVKLVNHNLQQMYSNETSNSPKCVHIGCQTSLTMLFNVQNDPFLEEKYIPKWKIQAKKEKLP